jgi:hypothetical protein
MATGTLGSSARDYHTRQTHYLAKAVAVGFKITLPSKATKPKAVSEIKRKLTEQKGSAQRIAPIGSS